MSKESKKDRIARGMYDQVAEHMHELTNLERNPGTKELDVERWVQSVLRSCLGFSASNGYSIRAQETRGKMRPDLIVLKNDKPVLVVEVKKLDFGLDKASFRSGKTQLREYMHSLENVHWGLLCNGHEWRLFDFSDHTNGGVEIYSLDVRGEADKIETGKRAIEDTCWSFVELYEGNLASGAWQDLAKEATAFSPESLAKAMLSADAVRYIARAIRGEHEIKANFDVLVDKIAALVEHGLNDQDKGWNDAKRADLTKYIKSQKRASRRKKKIKSEKSTVDTSSTDQAIETDTGNIDSQKSVA